MAKAQRLRSETPRGKEIARASSLRMQQNNPMHDPEVIQKMRRTKEVNGTLRPEHPWQGGNGRPLPEAQKLVLAALHGVAEFVVLTRGIPKELNPPYCYKIDVALPEKKLAIEVDGDTHRSDAQKTQDNKKDSILRKLGWTVIRVSNKAILKDYERTMRLLKETANSISACMTLKLRRTIRIQ